MSLTAVLFVALVFAVEVVVARVIRRISGPGFAAILVAIYLVIPAVLAAAGFLNRYTPLPAPALLVVFGVSAVTIVLSLTRVGARLAHDVGLASLIAMQSFRLPLEWLLHRLYLDGVIPVEMTYAGRNFDVFSGLSAAVIGGWMLTGRTVPRAALLAWNVICLILLTNIVIIAVLSTPVPFRYFFDGPANTLPSTFPYVWLPTVLVQVALGGHLIIFRALARREVR